MSKVYANIFPEIIVNKSTVEKMQPGFTLTNFYNRELKVPITAVVMDFQGVVRWFFQNGETPDARGDIDVRSDPKGILIGGTNHLERDNAVFPALVGWNQKVIWRGKIVNHHHIHRSKNGNFIFLTKEAREIDGTIVAADIIVEYDPNKRLVVWMWRLLDYVIPDDVKAVAIPVLSHRIICQSGYGNEDASNEKVVIEAMRKAVVPTETISE